MKRPTIWFNRGLPETIHLVKALKAAQTPADQFQIIATHRKHRAELGTVCEFHEEPVFDDQQAYVEWCLSFAREKAVDVLIPHRHAYALASARDRFQAIGCRLIVAGAPETLALVKSKAALYAALQADRTLTVPLPPFKVARDAGEFEAAVTALRADFETVCMKPTVGLGGQGFRVISDRPLAGPVNGDQPPMTLAEALAGFASMPGLFAELMIMPYLSGPETSVDCLADNGRLIASVVRTKFGSAEGLIEDGADMVDWSRQITRLLGLSGLFNVQFLEAADGSRQLLEVNARMAGGVFFGAFSGLLLPYWAIRLALGTAAEADIPRPKTGIRFHRVTGAVIAAM